MSVLETDGLVLRHLILNDAPFTVELLARGVEALKIAFELRLRYARDEDGPALLMALRVLT